MVKVGDTVTIMGGEHKGKMGVVAFMDLDLLHVILKPSNVVLTEIYTEEVNKVTGINFGNLKDIQEQYSELMAQHS